MHCKFTRCRTPLEARIDRLGRVEYRCPACSRRRAGLCQRCSRPVAGTIGRSLYCAAHRTAAQLASTARWYDRDRDAINERKKLAKRRDPRRPMTPQESGRLGGQASGPGRMRNLTAARRQEIARAANAARRARRGKSFPCAATVPV